MPSRIRSEVVDLNGRTPEELASLVAGCRVVFERVFTALGEGDFVRLLFGANTRYNRIKVFRDDTGRVIGFLAVALFEMNIDGRRYGIFRTPVAFLPEFQGRGAFSPMTFYFREAVRCRLTSPKLRLYFLNNTIGPQAYQMAAKYVWRSYPSPRYPFIPRVEQSILDHCSGFFNWGPPDDGYPFTRRMPLRASIEPHALDTSKPYIRFFLEHNPRYTDGYGIPYIIPVAMTNFVPSSLLYVRHIVTRSVRNLRRILLHKFGAST